MKYFNEIRRREISMRPTAEAVEAGGAPNLDCHVSFLPSM